MEKKYRILMKSYLVVIQIEKKSNIARFDLKYRTVSFFQYEMYLLYGHGSASTKKQLPTLDIHFIRFNGGSRGILFSLTKWSYFAILGFCRKYTILPRNPRPLLNFLDPPLITYMIRKIFVSKLK